MWKCRITFIEYLELSGRPEFNDIFTDALSFPVRADVVAERLRAAQMEMLRVKQWQSPYYWAPFVMQGEWR